MEERRGEQCGQGSVEYVGLLALLALAATALLALAPAGALRELGLGVCDAAGFCDGAVGIAPPAPPPTPAESYRAALALPLEDFLALRASPERDARLDWTEDGCSRVPDRPLSSDFFDSCVRHDFAYRNAALIGYVGRAEADARLRVDMRLACEAASDSIAARRCRALAEVYYGGVRALGSGSYHPVEREYFMGP